MTYLIEREPAQAEADDYNGAGTITVPDAVLLARFVAEDADLTDVQITGILNARSDFDSDGLVTILDVMLILQKLTE